MPVVIVPPIDGSPIPSGPTPSPAVAIPEQVALTPLEFLREKIGYSPYLFWGQSNSKVLHGSQCNSVIYEYAYQAADQVGRSAMREALLNAELDIRRELKFSVAPHFGEEEVNYLSTNLLAQNALSNFAQWGAGDVFGRWTGIFLNEGYINALGYEDLEFLGDAALTYSDQNNDDLYDSFTATILTDETDPLKIAVYFSSVDRLDSEGVSETWRIQPVSVVIASGVATIRGRSWMMVKPILQQMATQQTPIDPDDLTKFVSTVAIYTRTTNPTGTEITNAQATLIWETSPLPMWCCNSITQNSTDPATVGYAVGRAGIRNGKMGEVTPAQASYNAETGKWNQAYPCYAWRPDRVKVRFNAGYPLDADGQVNKGIRDAVTTLAIANMDERLCACDVANKALYYWQFDLAHVQSNLEAYATTQQQLNNIFGTKRGQVAAWRKIKHLVLHRAVSY